MDFYLDTGTIYGRIDHTDIELNPCCINFFRRYPFNAHNFFTTKYIVKGELDNVRLKRTRGLPKIGREVERRARLLLEKITDIEYSQNEIFKPLSSELEAFLLSAATPTTTPKDHDAKLLAHAYLWEKNMSGLQNPHFVTTDGIDINNNRRNIQLIAEKHLSCKTGLYIAFVKSLLN
jgi:hypothetical protein